MYVLLLVAYSFMGAPKKVKQINKSDVMHFVCMYVWGVTLPLFFYCGVLQGLLMFVASEYTASSANTTYLDKGARFKSVQTSTLSYLYTQIIEVY